MDVKLDMKPEVRVDREAESNLGVTGSHYQEKRKLVFQHPPAADSAVGGVSLGALEEDRPVTHEVRLRPPCSVGQSKSCLAEADCFYLFSAIFLSQTYTSVAVEQANAPALAKQ